MSEHYEPTNNEPDELSRFDNIISELEGHMADPYLEGIHFEARYLQSTLADTQADEMAGRHVEYVKQQRWLDEEKATSKGFIVFTDDNATPPSQKIGHIVFIDSGAGNGTVEPAIICLDDLVHLELPFASPELRERRFAYYFPDEALLIDELVATSPRDDQAIRSLGEFHLDLNFDDPDHVEHARDAAQYLRSRIELEPRASYHASISGDVIVIKDDGDGIPIKLVKPYVRTMIIEDVAFRPADTRVEEIAGNQRCVPFVEAIAFEADGTDREFIVPCHSIDWISSTRYTKPSVPKN